MPEHRNRQANGDGSVRGIGVTTYLNITLTVMEVCGDLQQQKTNTVCKTK